MEHGAYLNNDLAEGAGALGLLLEGLPVLIRLELQQLLLKGT